MQIIVVSRHLKAARTFHIMPRHLLLAAFGFVFLVLATSTFFSWLSVQLRLPLMEEMVVSVFQRESKATQAYVSNNLQLMATRIGELQAQVLQLDSVSERLAGQAGLKRDAVPVKAPGQGGPFIPAALSADLLQKEIDRLASEVESKTDELLVLESMMLDKRVRNRLLPTTLPVKRAELGSPFGHRSDPIAGLRAMHEGIDFNAEVGTPVVVAADGVVVSAAYHPEFGNLIDVEHGPGLLSRYAHLSRMDVKAGQLLKRGDLLGAVGTTGRSTGPHLHFEVRLQGAPQNPARFLKLGDDYAQLKRR